MSRSVADAAARTSPGSCVGAEGGSIARTRDQLIFAANLPEPVGPPHVILDQTDGPAFELLSWTTRCMNRLNTEAISASKGDHSSNGMRATS